MFCDYGPHDNGRIYIYIHAQPKTTTIPTYTPKIQTTMVPAILGQNTNVQIRVRTDQQPTKQSAKHNKTYAAKLTR